MRIESGTTTEHRVRLGIFLAMCIFFAGYFAVDGLWRYPAKNLEWAKQNIQDTRITPEQKASITTNPKVLVATLASIEARSRQGTAFSQAEIRDLLGEPAIVLPQPDGDGQDAWYVGPATYARVRFVDGKLTGIEGPREGNINKSEEDIWLQKVLGAVLGVLAVGIGIHYVRIMTMKTVLDDAGLKAKGRKVAWEDMTELDTSDYSRKGWLDVVYRRNGDTDSVRLDSYHIASFDEIVNTICERKGFATPIKPPGAETAEEDA